MKAFELRDVWEKYRIKFLAGGDISWEEVYVLQGISLSVEQGEVVGIIGHNGAGKSTLLKLIAGMLLPDKGGVEVTGKVSALMELGAGFNPEFTGRENITMNARVYGIRDEEINTIAEKIIDFAGLGRFIDAPIKYYSQGMYMRLAFSLAIFVEPEILLIDDILAVGDEDSHRKCTQRIFEMKKSGKTIVVVSHDMTMIRNLCDRIILLENGKIVKEGKPDKVIARYLESTGNKDGMAAAEQDKLRLVFNNGKVMISYEDVYLTRGDGGYFSYFDGDVGVWTSSLTLSWNVKKISAQEIIAEGSFPGNPPAQIWKIRLEKNSVLVDIETKSEHFKDAHVDLMIPNNFQEWFSLQAQGEFPGFLHKSTWQDAAIGVQDDDVVGLRASKEFSSTPGIIVRMKNRGSRFKLFNTGYLQESRVIQLVPPLHGSISFEFEIIPVAEEFNTMVGILKSEFSRVKQFESEKQKILRTISSEDAKLFADVEQKVFRLFYRENEITKAEGLYVSLLLNNVWYTSGAAQWAVEREHDSLVVRLNWPQLKCSQVWKMYFRGQALVWDVVSDGDGSLVFSSV
ncbi:MAG: ABC transporter ATP-binding protein, partial [Candidatus Omnitrophica bacterium]|nr:ABC transporter ATP-binding protein [Candidatus Omnitrophota bacterium]